MNKTSFFSTANSDLEVRVHRAIRASHNSLPQVAVLIFSLEPDSRISVLESNLMTFRNAMLMRLRNSLRESDYIAWLTNGHLAVLLQTVQGPQDLDLIINRLLSRLREPVQINEVVYIPEPRVGSALYPENGDCAERLIEYAELELADGSSNRCTRQATVFRSRGFTARQWMSELRQAIVSDQLFLAFQPKVDLLKGPVTGVEVLLRWRHPKHGIIVPDQFIPVAERTGLIMPLTLWVLQRSLMQCRQWHRLGLRISVAVNLTMWNLETHELPNQIEALLRDTGVPPENLELEITETSIMSDPQRVIRTLNQIRQLGVHFAIDDFGTGYSSFSYLAKLPVSCIKIDKSFVQTIETDRDNSVIVKSMIDLGHNLGLKVVAEGVETLTAQQMLTALQCDDGQGYHFSKPIPAEPMTQLLLRAPFRVDPPPIFNQLAEEKSSPLILDYNTNL